MLALLCCPGYYGLLFKQFVCLYKQMRHVPQRSKIDFTQFEKTHGSSLINIEKILNRPITKFLNSQKQPPEVFHKKGLVRNFAKFTGKHLCQRLFFNKVTGLRPVTLLKKSLWHRCFPVNFTKFLRTAFLQNTSRRLLLNSNDINFILLETCFIRNNANRCKKKI